MTAKPAAVAEYEGPGQCLGQAPVLVVCEHASNRIPARWGTLGLDADALRSHIAWDPGALPLARRLATALGAGLLRATVSRLVYDLNRAPGAADAVTPRSERTDIPGNRGLSPAERAERAEAVYAPWLASLDAAVRQTGAAALVTVHSFTPVYAGVRRDTRVGILHDRDRRLADAVLAAAGEGAPGWHRNRPYGPEDGVTHTVNLGAARGLAPLMIEVRNDLLTTDADIAAMADEILPPLAAALADLGIVQPEAQP